MSRKIYVGNESQNLLELDKDLKLKVLYEDPEVIVTMAPNESELKDIVLDMLKSEPKTIKDIHSKLAGIASEDKIRRCLTKLVNEGIVVVDEEGRYSALGSNKFDGEIS
ncbi:MAG: ArsR family transcriptional regulator [Ignisphaera sp.]|uniref:ArsR family transcriptional regulator n=1 Tax=Ignisphaera aggregans TaxID=334771 RepID=A0A7C4NLX8_9CREN